jgi:hypothetical protein
MRLTPSCPPLTPDYSKPSPSAVPNLHVEEMLWQLYREAKTAAENFRRQRDEARAALRNFKARGKVIRLAKNFKPGENQQ